MLVGCWRIVLYLSLTVWILLFFSPVHLCLDKIGRYCTYLAHNLHIRGGDWSGAMEKICFLFLGIVLFWGFLVFLCVCASSFLSFSPSAFDFGFIFWIFLFHLCCPSCYCLFCHPCGTVIHHCASTLSCPWFCHPCWKTIHCYPLILFHILPLHWHWRNLYCYQISLYLFLFQVLLKRYTLIF